MSHYKGPLWRVETPLSKCMQSQGRDRSAAVDRDKSLSPRAFLLFRFQREPGSQGAGRSAPLFSSKQPSSQAAKQSREHRLEVASIEGEQWQRIRCCSFSRPAEEARGRVILHHDHHNQQDSADATATLARHPLPHTRRNIAGHSSWLHRGRRIFKTLARSLAHYRRLDCTIDVGRCTR